MITYAEPDHKTRVRQALTMAGAQVMDARVVDAGLAWD